MLKFRVNPRLISVIEFRGDETNNEGFPNMQIVIYLPPQHSN